jgi:tetratricopeptide (TPR) repeat protein
VAAYQRAIELAPRRSYLYLSLGHALRALKRYDEALQVFSIAADLAPTDPRPSGGIGMIYYAREEYEAALPPLERSIQIDPNYANGYAQLAWIAYVQAAYPKAQPLFERAIELDSDRARQAQYRHALGWSYVNTHQASRAREQFVKALELNPDLQGARDGLAQLDRQ